MAKAEGDPPRLGVGLLYTKQSAMRKSGTHINTVLQVGDILLVSHWMPTIRTVCYFHKIQSKETSGTILAATTTEIDCCVFPVRSKHEIAELPGKEVMHHIIIKYKYMLG